ncbi:MAG: TonB-dependent receptor [Acidobacteria bacterium]|nr:TonB-dependent receptor [Acidobacteriota bacterium]
MLAVFHVCRAFCRVALIGLCALTPMSALAQETVTVQGTVMTTSAAPISGAVLRVGDASETTRSDGTFSLEVAAGDVILTVRHPDYFDVDQHFGVAELAAAVEIRMTPRTIVDEVIEVVGIRADADMPITTAEVDREELDKISYGQDVPAALQYQPSMNWYSDSGVGSNYSYFSLRGIQQTRINITYDGAPLNDPAEHALYFNNFHDFLSEVESVQVQRGVGTSTVGSPAYGGSVNFASRPPAVRPGITGRVQLGSYDTARFSLGGQTGDLGNGFWASGRYSYSDTDGYREHSGSRHNTLFLNGGWQGERSSLRFTGFAGSEESQLAWLAVDPATLAENRRFNPLDEEERDDFGQRFAQLRYLRGLDDDWVVTAAAYYNGADGWFRLWDSPAQAELLQFGIDQGFWGTMLTASRTTREWAISFGAHYNDFAGDHTLDSGATRYYLNTGYKQSANAWAKAEYRTGDWILFGDAQLRWAKFRYEGDIDLGSVDWTFLDPKVGARYALSPSSSLYASIGKAQREPARLDLLAGEDNATVAHDLNAVRPESVTNLEVGYNLRTATVALQANLYAMEFRDEIALTGELSDIGLPIRTNVDESYRRGLELDLRWRFAPEWTLLHSLNLSRNRIANWTQFYDVYDSNGAWIGSTPIDYTNVRPLLTPETIVNVGAEWSRGATALAATGRYVSESQLDNTGLAAFRTPSFTSVDLRGSIGLGDWWPSGGPRLNVFVNNLFSDTDQLPSGYSYQFLNQATDGSTSLDGIPFYYPLATRHIVASIEFDLQ